MRKKIKKKPINFDAFLHKLLSKTGEIEVYAVMPKKLYKALKKHALKKQSILREL